MKNFFGAIVALLMLVFATSSASVAAAATQAGGHACLTGLSAKFLADNPAVVQIVEAACLGDMDRAEVFYLGGLEASPPSRMSAEALSNVRRKMLEQVREEWERTFLHVVNNHMEAGEVESLLAGEEENRHYLFGEKLLEVAYYTSLCSEVKCS